MMQSTRSYINWTSFFLVCLIKGKQIIVKINELKTSDFHPMTKLMGKHDAKSDMK